MQLNIYSFNVFKYVWTYIAITTVYTYRFNVYEFLIYEFISTIVTYVYKYLLLFFFFLMAKTKYL